MKKEIDIKGLCANEIKCLYALQIAINFKSRFLSYGYADDSICLSKINNEWCIYFVDKGQMFDLRRFSDIYLASMQIIAEISETKEEQTNRLMIFSNTLREMENQNEIYENKIQVLKK